MFLFFDRCLNFLRKMSILLNHNIYQSMSHFSYGGSHLRKKYSNNSESEYSSPTQQEPEFTQEEKYNQMLLIADELIKREEFDEGIEKLRLIMEKVNFMKQNKKDYDKKLELVIIYNMAAAFQKQWNLDECIPFLEKFISLTKNALQDNLKTSGSMSLHQNANKHWFKLKTVLVKGLLQYCAVLSQVGEHKKALKMAIQITVQLKQLFKRGYDECNKQIVKKQSYNQKRASNKKIQSSKSITGNDKIEFSYSVLLNAREVLQQLIKMQTYNDIIDNSYSQTQTEMKEVKSKIYYWKSNPQNNIKTLRQSFNVSEPIETEQSKKTNADRNLLGIKRNQSWIEEFTIAKIMFMTPINYLEFCDYDNLIFEFNQRNLLEKVILLSVAYFSLSIELRFLQEDGNSGNEKRTKSKQKQSNLSKSDSIKKSEQLQKSQIFHLKSIEIVCKHIKENSAFVSHLVVNYHKHYKNNLNIIEEENSIAQYSQLYVRKTSKNNASFDEGDVLIPLESVRSSPKNILTPTVYRKDSVYYKDQNQEISAKIQNQKSQGTVFDFKKSSKNRLQQNQQKSERSRKLGNSSSFSRFETDLNSQKDKTMKKTTGSKMITVGKFDNIRMIMTDRNEKELSNSKHLSTRSIDKKSLSKSKNFLKNSITLKQNKSQSPQKDRSKAKQIRDLKDSADFSKRDFAKKKSPEVSSALDLLKKSGSLNEIQMKSSKDLGSARAHVSPTVQIKKKR